MRRPLLLAILMFAPGIALAANCPGFAYTLSNGQVADATQVMSNFNSLLNCSNTNLAHNGANTDITSLSGLTTPLSLGQGGTGNTSGTIPVGQLGTIGSNTIVGNNTGASAYASALSTSQVAAMLPAFTGDSGSGGVQGLVPAPSSGNAASLYFLGANGTWQTTNFGQLFAANFPASGTSSGESLGNAAWTKRVIGGSTAVTNTISGASISSNSVTLPAGTYIVSFGAPAYSATVAFGEISRIRDTTDSVTLCESPAASGAATPVTTVNSGTCEFHLTGSKVLELDTWVNNTPVSGGSAMTTGDYEWYASVLFTKVGA